MRNLLALVAILSTASAFHVAPGATRKPSIAPRISASAIPATNVLAARSGGRVGGRVGGGMRGGGGGYRGGGGMYAAPMPMMSPFGFSPFGFGMPFSPFGFGFGFGIPFPLLVLLLAGVAATSFRSSRGIEASESAGAALCLQVACYCDNRSDSLYSRLGGIAKTADTSTEVGLQNLVSDACLAMLRSSKDWLAGRTASETAGILTNDVEPSYNRFVVQERAKWESERRVLTRTAPGQPTYMVATLVVLLRQGSTLPDISGATDLRQALQNLAAEVSVEDNLMGAELLWTPEDANDVMDRDDMFLNFPELVTI